MKGPQERTFWIALFLLLIPLLVFALSTAAAEAHRRSPADGGPPDESAVIRELQSPDLYTRRRAAFALSAIEPLSQEAIAAALRAPKQPDPMGVVQRQVVVALGKTGAPAIPALTEVMEGKEGNYWGIRDNAVHALGAMAAREPAAWPPLIAALKDPELQGLASLEIAKIGGLMVPLLKKALQDPDPRVRRGAVAALQMAPGEASQATPELTNELKETDPNVRLLAAADLARIGPQAKSAAPALAALLKDPKREVRDEAALALARVDPDNSASVPILIQALEYDQSIAHWDAVDALKGMGGNARAAIPTLEHLLATDHDPRFRVAIAGVLGPIEGANAVPALVRTLTGDNEIQVRRAALDAISKLGPTVTATIPGLIQALRDGDQQIRGAAADALAAIGKPATPALLAALHNADLYTREGAVTALSKSKPLPDDVVRALTAAASDDKSMVVRYETANILDRAGIAGGHAALEKAQQVMDAAMTEPPAVDTKRLYRRPELFADVPPDNNHEYPLHLVYLLSFNAPRAEMLAAVYRGPERRDRLIFWRQSGDDRYQQMQAIDAGPDPSDVFDPPNEVFIPKGQVPGLGVRFVDVGVSLWRGHGDYVFAIDGDELRPVEIESPEQWYRDKLQPGEEIVSRSANSFFDREAQFSFYVRRGKKTEQVVGTYKVVREAAAGPGPGIPGRFSTNTIKETAGNPLTIWKLAVDNARRGPIPRADE